jgi:tetratricopeptide (TPR) repeat protein
MRHQPSLNADDLQDRKDYAAKLKAAGNKAYGSKDYNRAIDLYGKAILCKQDPVFYSNRAACYNAMSEWDKVIEDTTAAINLDNEYVKALNRRANAYEQVERNSEALLDYTASCIIDGFRNESSAQSVERLLKKVADAKGKAILASKEKKLPSPTSPPPSNRTPAIPTSSTTAHNYTSSSPSLARLQRTTRSRSISTRTSSSLTSNLVSHNTRWAASPRPWPLSAAA